MPNPRNRIKQTGDTRLPQGTDDLDDDLDDAVDGTGTQPEAAVFHPAASGMAAGQSAQGRSATMAASAGGRLAAGRDALQERGRQLGQTSQDYLAEARGQVLDRPLASLGGAFLLGFVLARLTR